MGREAGRTDVLMEQRRRRDGVCRKYIIYLYVICFMKCSAMYDKYSYYFLNS